MVQRHRGVQIGDRLDLLVGRVQGLRPELQESRTVRRREVVRKAERATVLGGRLTVRAYRGRAGRRGARVAHRRPGLAGDLRVMREAGRIRLCGP